MNRDEFDVLVKRLEKFAADSPKAYALRVGMLAVLGYAYLFFVLALLILGTTALGWVVIMFPNGLTIKLGIVWGIFMMTLGFNILRSMWVRLSAPEGTKLERKDFPQIFEMVDDLSRKLNAPFFHDILLVSEYNAAVVQTPRLGIFGWHRNYLLLGLPLMEGLSPDQFKAVVAHEMGHLSGNHSRFAGWIYRVRHTWDQLLHHLIHSQEGRGAGLFSKFIQWYSPYFGAYSFVLARSNEYVADRCAVDLAGRENAANALINVQVHSRLLDETFWPDIYKQVTTSTKPPQQSFVHLATALHRGPGTEDAIKWLKQSWLVQTNNADTHPCLRDRLSAMGYPNDLQQPPALPPSHEHSAAQHYFGQRLDEYRDKLTNDWEKSVEEAWHKRHEEALEEARKLEILSASPEALDIEKQWEQALLVKDLKGEAEALPLIRAILTKEPTHAGANFFIGQQLLERDDETGIAYLEKAANKEPHAVSPVCNLLYGYYQRTGQHDKLRGLEKRVDDHEERLGLAQAERNSLNPNDNYQEHSLPPEKLAELATAFAKEAEIETVWLVRKVLAHFPENPLYVMAIKPNVKWYSLRSSDANSNLAQRLVKVLPLPRETLLFIHADNLMNIGKKIAKISGSQIYHREEA